MQREIWKYQSTQEVLREFIQSQIRGGWGESARISKSLGIHTSLLSQIVSGARTFTLEQGAKFCDYAAFSESETNLFLCLLSWERAGNSSLKEKYAKQIKILRKDFLNVKSRVQDSGKELNSTDRQMFYSSWKYSAIRMLCTLNTFTGDINELAKQLDISEKTGRDIINFLRATGLIVEKKKGLSLGIKSTHVQSQDPLVKQHHLNWRIRHLSKLEKVEEDELCFTAPLSCSYKDVEKLKTRLLEVIEEF